MRTLILFLVISQTICAQKHFTRTGTTEFKASIDAFEPVEAINNSSSVILKVNTSEIAVLIPIKAFKFRVALMQEHFNENYMDSDEFPKATFKGKIKDFDFSNISSKSKYHIQGTLTIRNISNNVKILADIVKKDSKLLLKSNFTVKAEDYGIKIPSIVRKKIAEKINISLNYELKEKN